MFDFSPSKQRINKKRIYGFDIETYDNNKSFYCCSLYGDDIRMIITSIKVLKLILLSGYFNDSIIVATNLSFDFFGVFFNDPKGFNFIFRGSDLLMARTYIYDKRFNHRPKGTDGHDRVMFIDTMNYAHLSVKNLGKIIDIPKLKTPSFIGKQPKGTDQICELLYYNLRDSEVSQKALKFLYQSFQDLGATPKVTIASTSMSIFRNVYLDRKYRRHNTDIIREQFKGYYGGRTEAFKRGRFTDHEYYDINSLYPFVMRRDFPDPSTLHIRHNASKDILNFEGLSHVRICSPLKRYPYLPYRTDDKLIFPYGTFEGYYTHFELRKALEKGYKIIRIYKTFYYTKSIKFFGDFVDDLYKKRLYYKSISSPMQYVIKICMNSLYGKFGQKFDDKDNILPFNQSAQELSRYKSIEVISKNYIRVVEDREPSVFCFPIIACHVTAYARDVLFNYIERHNAIYCDTDSIITTDKIKESKDLGDMKLEHHIDKGIIVKPKFYALIDSSGTEISKLKGVSVRFVFNDFIKLLSDPKISYKKFTKLRESLRRGFIPNEIQNITKHLNLEDNKREWGRDFNSRILQDSTPRRVIT